MRASSYERRARKGRQRTVRRRFREGRKAESRLDALGRVWWHRHASRGVSVSPGVLSHAIRVLLLGSGREARGEGGEGRRPFSRCSRRASLLGLLRCCTFPIDLCSTILEPHLNWEMRSSV